VGVYRIVSDTSVKYKVNKKLSCRWKTHWSQFWPSTFSLQVHIPVAELHSGSLSWLPASRHSHWLSVTHTKKNIEMLHGNVVYKTTQNLRNLIQPVSAKTNNRSVHNPYSEIFTWLKSINVWTTSFYLTHTNQSINQFITYRGACYNVAVTD